jgi:hypothetical protein
MIQTAVWLPRDMHEKLKKGGGERGLGEEIRRQIQYALDAAKTPSDQITDEVVGQIKDVTRDLSDWHADPFVFRVLRGAIEVVLSNHEPKGEGKPEAKSRLQAMYGEQTPEAIGRIIGFVAIKAYARERWGKAFLEGPKG